MEQKQQEMIDRKDKIIVNQNQTIIKLKNELELREVQLTHYNAQSDVQYKHIDLLFKMILILRKQLLDHNITPIETVKPSYTITENSYYGDDAFNSIKKT